MSISLNGFKIELSAQTFKAYVQELPNNQEIKSIREALGSEWFSYWREGKVYGIPNVTTVQTPFGQPEELVCNEHFQLLASRISDLLPSIFKAYKPLKYKPFIFLAQKEEKELVSAITNKINGLPEIISSFKIFPKYILEPKIFAIHNDEAGLGLFLRLKTSWQIQASLTLLQSEGVDLQEDISTPEKQKPDRVKIRLSRLLVIGGTIAGIVAGAADFSNNVLELSQKLNVPIELNHHLIKKIPPSTSQP